MTDGQQPNPAIRPQVQPVPTASYEFPPPRKAACYSCGETMDGPRGRLCKACRRREYLAAAQRKKRTGDPIRTLSLDPAQTRELYDMWQFVLIAYGEANAAMAREDRDETKPATIYDLLPLHAAIAKMVDVLNQPMREIANSLDVISDPVADE